MNAEDELQVLWHSVSKIALPLAEVRDRYVQLSLLHPRFGQLGDAYTHLNTIEQALSEYLEFKKPLLGAKPDREFLMLARSALEVGKTLLLLATDEANQTFKPTKLSNQRLSELADLAEQLSRADKASQSPRTDNRNSDNAQNR